MASKCFNSISISSVPEGFFVAWHFHRHTYS